MPGNPDAFVKYNLGSGKGACDEIFSFPKDAPEGKGNKTFVSAHSGYAVELVGVVDRSELMYLDVEGEL